METPPPTVTPTTASTVVGTVQLDEEESNNLMAMLNRANLSGLERTNPRFRAAMEDFRRTMRTRSASETTTTDTPPMTS